MYLSHSVYEIFKEVHPNELKQIANNHLKNIQILIYTNPQKITNEKTINDILDKVHNTLTGGHIGQYKMYKKIRREYSWNKMKKTIKEFLDKCLTCKLNKHQTKTAEPFVKTDTPNTPFEAVSIDTVGPFQKTNNNNRYAVTIQCNLTKHVTVIAIPNKEANTVARAEIEKIMLIYGTNIKEFRTDMGTEYKNEIFKNISEILKIEHKFSTPYHPQTIGALERNHRCLNEYLRMFTNEHKDDWDDWINYYSFAYNTTPNLDHGYTPFELVFGRNERITPNVKDTYSPLYNYDDYSKEFKYRLKIAHDRTRKHIEQVKFKLLKEQQNINQVNFEIGDQIALTNENRTKLDPVYKGPYKVKEINGPNMIIENTEGVVQKIHKNRAIKL